MAESHSDYHKGDMEVNAQRHTFSGFMGFTVYGGGLIALGLLFPILTVGGVGLPWLPALLITLVSGIIAGILLKLKATWFATIIMMSFVTAIICGIISALF